jgi:hypothetical protein
MASGGSISICQTKVTPSFIFGTPQTQIAAETVYEAKKAEVANAITGAANPSNVRHDVNLIFRTDYQRMQYLMGLYGRTAQGLR